MLLSIEYVWIYKLFLLNGLIIGLKGCILDLMVYMIIVGVFDEWM